MWHAVTSSLAYMKLEFTREEKAPSHQQKLDEIKTQIQKPSVKADKIHAHAWSYMNAHMPRPTPTAYVKIHVLTLLTFKIHMEKRFLRQDRIHVEDPGLVPSVAQCGPKCRSESHIDLHPPLGEPLCSTSSPALLLFLLTNVVTLIVLLHVDLSPHRMWVRH